MGRRNPPKSHHIFFPFKRAGKFKPNYSFGSILYITGNGSKIFSKSAHQTIFLDSGPKDPIYGLSKNTEGQLQTTTNKAIKKEN